MSTAHIGVFGSATQAKVAMTPANSPSIPISQFGNGAFTCHRPIARLPRSLLSAGEPQRDRATDTSWAHLLTRQSAAFLEGRHARAEWLGSSTLTDGPGNDVDNQRFQLNVHIRSRNDTRPRTLGRPAQT